MPFLHSFPFLSCPFGLSTPEALNGANGNGTKRGQLRDRAARVPLLLLCTLLYQWRKQTVMNGITDPVGALGPSHPPRSRQLTESYFCEKGNQPTKNCRQSLAELTCSSTHPSLALAPLLFSPYLFHISFFFHFPSMLSFFLHLFATHCLLNFLAIVLPIQ